MGGGQAAGGPARPDGGAGGANGGGRLRGGQGSAEQGGALGGGGPSLRTDPAIWATQVDRKMFFVHFFPFSRDQLNGLGQQRCFFPLSRTHLGRQGDVTLSPQPGS